MGMIDGARTRLHLLFGRRAAERRMDEEMRFHVDMEAERLIREERLDESEARRRALVAFGGQDRYREEMRDGRGLAWLSGLSLDFKLGLRMLLRYPGITAAATLAIAVAVALAAGVFEFATLMAAPRIPLPEGDRVVVVQNWDEQRSEPENRVLHDFEEWRASLTSLEDLGAFSHQEMNVTTEDGRFLAVKGARVTASLIRIPRAPPLHGRLLTAADEAPGAPLVVVLGYEVWQSLFAGDPRAVGSTVRLGAVPATVVGVMPRGFSFPTNHQLWSPLQERAVAYPRLQGPPVSIAGRLAPGVSLEEAQTELAALGARRATAFPGVYDHVRPRVLKLEDVYAMTPLVHLMNLPFLLLLIVVCANVATLVFARTATRGSEIAVRSALGASRRRLVLQLFAEALALTLSGTALGLAAANAGYGWGMELFLQVQDEMTAPFWFTSSLSLPTILYACALAVLAAAIIGGVPALKATGRRLRHQLAQPGSGGAGLRFGAVSTAVVVIQVAICVAFLPLAIVNGRTLLPEDRPETAFPATRFLTGRFTHQAAGLPDAAAAKERAALFDEVRRRIGAEEGVVAVTFSDRMPGFNHPVEDVRVEGDTSILAFGRVAAVDTRFLEVMGGRIVSGRALRAEDEVSAVPVVIVDEAWAREHLRGRNAVGQRIRMPGRPDAEGEVWREIIGVVAGIEPALGPAESTSLFEPLRLGARPAAQFYVRTTDAPELLAPRVAQTIAALDPALGVSRMMRLDEAWSPVLRSNRFFLAGMSLVATVLVGFALIGIVALMSFTVSQRAREIGIRTALGARPRRIVLSIFSRAFRQLGLGVLIGGAMVSYLLREERDGLQLVAGVAALMTAFGLLGCVLPARRALRIQPTDALRAE